MTMKHNIIEESTLLQSTYRYVVTEKNNLRTLNVGIFKWTLNVLSVVTISIEFYKI